MAKHNPARHWTPDHNSRRSWAVIGWLALTATLASAASPPAPTSQLGQPDQLGAPGPAMGAGGGASDELLQFMDMPVVVGASKHEQRPQEAAASVSLVTREDIELYGYHSLADILRTQPGFFIHSDGLNSFLGVRGFLRPGEWNARILVLIDGRPTREAIFGQTHLDEGMVVPIELIKRVEIIRGPGSTLYGSNAVFAVINIITRDGADVKNYGELVGQAGTKETFGGSAVFGKKFSNGWDLIAGAEPFGSEGDTDVHFKGVHDADRNFGHIRNHDSEEYGDFFAKASKDDWTFELDYSKRDKDNRDATFLTSWLNPGWMEEQRASASGRWDHAVSEEVSLHAQAYYAYYNYWQEWGVDTDEKLDAYTYYTAAQSQWTGQDFHVDWKTNPKNRLIAGVEAMESIQAHQRDTDSVDGALLNVEQSTNWWAPYVQDEYAATDWMTLIAGLRADFVERFDPQIDPRFAVVLTPDKDDTVKLMYGRAFRAPNLYELYYSSPGANDPNIRLQPEINDTYEVAWTHDFHGGWTSDASVYYWKMTDAMRDGVGPTDGLKTINDGTDSAGGVEYEVQKRWENGARIRAGASVGHAVDDDHQWLDNSPNVILNFNAAIPVINKRTFLAVETQMIGPMRVDTGQHSDPSFLTNIVLTSKEVLKNMDLQVGLYNLFASSVEIPRDNAWDQSQLWLRQPDPLLMVSVKFRF